MGLVKEQDSPKCLRETWGNFQFVEGVLQSFGN